MPSPRIQKKRATQPCLQPVGRAPTFHRGSGLTQSFAEAVKQSGQQSPRRPATPKRTITPDFHRTRIVYNSAFQHHSASPVAQRVNTTPARPQRASPVPTVSTPAATGCASARTSSAERAQRQLLERIAHDKSSPTPPHLHAPTAIPLSNRYEALTLLSGRESDYADDRADEILLTSAVRPIAKGKHAFAGKRKSTRMPRALAKRMDSHQPRLFFHYGPSAI